jgi:AcrR family transcriptional regulator
MNPYLKTKSDDTHARIMATAETLFRRLGYNKTTVADIAAELRMSPANIYRFFDSKNAIVDAICRRCLSEVEEKVWAVARSKASAADRMERLMLEILAYHKENFIADQRVAEMVIKTHKIAMNNVIELVVRDGIDAGEFELVDPHETAELIMRSLVAFTHPLFLAQCIEEGDDVEAQARASVRFILRAITPRR